MIVKALEVRDEGTTISMLAIKPTPDNPEQRAVLRHAGYGEPERYVILIGAHDCHGSYNPYSHGSHTRQVAHQWIKEHFDEIKDGEVIDVEYLLGKTSIKKSSEIQSHYRY